MVSGTLKFCFLLITLFTCVELALSICDETTSYNEERTKQARHREAGRPEREKYYKTLTAKQLERVSDFEIYPTLLMTCGMGFSEGLAKVWVDGKAGFIDSSGKIIIKPQFVDAGRFSRGMAPVEFANGRWGYINKAGAVVIEARFDWAIIFRENMALVKNNGKWGYINRTGKIVVDFNFDHANSFSDGLAHVQIMKDKFFSGYIDSKGKWVIPPEFRGGEDFINGTAIVLVGVWDEKSKHSYSEVYRIDKKGRKLGVVEGERRRPDSIKLDKADITMFYEEYKTGYKRKNGKVVWKPTK